MMNQIEAKRHNFEAPEFLVVFQFLYFSMPTNEGAMSCYHGALKISSCNGKVTNPHVVKFLAIVSK